MREIIKNPQQQGLPGELQRLKLALLTDQSGQLTTTRLRLVRLARARGIEPHLIDDIVQETLLEAWSHLERLHAPAGFNAWIDEICRNVCRRFAQRRRRELRHDAQLLRSLSGEELGDDDEEQDLLTDFPDTETIDPLEELSRQDLVALLDRALGALPQASRQMVEMCYLLELPRSEVAARLGISSGTLDVRLHRTRRQLYRILHGPLSHEAEALGLALDAEMVEGWQETRLWCPSCARHRLQGCFLYPAADSEEPNLHLRCPECSQRFGQDTVHSMGLVSLAGLRSFRPAWKRTMQGLTDRLLQVLSQPQRPCLYCGKPALIQVRGNDSAAAQPADLGNSGIDLYPFWIYLRCVHCDNDMDGCGCLPTVDQLVYWSHPLTRQFLQQHSRCSSEPGKIVEYQGQQAIYLQINDLESADRLTVLAHRQTLQILTLF